MADLAVSALVVAQAQPWNILYLLIIWKPASVFLRHASCTSKTRMQLYEIELIKPHAFNPSLLAVRGHFSSPWAFSLLNCKELLYRWQGKFMEWLFLLLNSVCFRQVTTSTHLAEEREVTNSHLCHIEHTDICKFSQTDKVYFLLFSAVHFTEVH